VNKKDKADYDIIDVHDPLSELVAMREAIVLYVNSNLWEPNTRKQTFRSPPDADAKPKFKCFCELVLII
jgi:hypothetical protein